MSDKASKKNKKAAGKKDQIDEETLSKLLDAKLKEFGISGEDDKDLKRISIHSKLVREYLTLFLYRKEV